MTEEEHFRRYFDGVRKLGVYGAGHYGQLLVRFISRLGIDIKIYYIDDFRAGNVSALEVVRPDAIPVDTDLIVVAMADLAAASEIAYGIRKQGCLTKTILLNNRLFASLNALDQAQKTRPLKSVTNLFLKLRRFAVKQADANYFKFTMKRLLHSFLISLSVLTNPHVRYRKDCPICGSKSYFLKKNIYGYKIHECRRCTHTFVANAPDKKALKRLYSGCDYFEIDRGHQGITSIGDSSQWKGFISGRMKWLDLFGLLNANQGKPLNVLEIGCLEGKLLDHLRRNGHMVYGCEINKEVAALGSKTFGIEIRSDSLEQCGFEEEFFDLILAFHVFEHFDDPLKHLRICRRLLRNNGRMLIEVPSGETDYNNLQHLHFFNEKSLAAMFDTIFDNVSMAPGCYRLFDTAYSQTIFVYAWPNG